MAFNISMSILSVEILLKRCYLLRTCSEEATAPCVSHAIGLPQGHWGMYLDPSSVGCFAIHILPRTTVAKATLLLRKVYLFAALAYVGWKI